MAGALRKTMVYLGLAEEDERYSYDGYDEETSVEESRDGSRHDGHVEQRRAQVTPISRERGVTSVVAEPVSDLRRITTIHPRTYNDAKAIGESFREGIPVIINLTDMDDADAKRLVDFSAGLVFGLYGTIERVTNKVFLLSPADVEVDGGDRSGTEPSGLFNQS